MEGTDRQAGRQAESCWPGRMHASGAGGRRGAESRESAGGGNGKTPQHTFCIWRFSNSSVSSTPWGHLEWEEVAKGTQVCARELAGMFGSSAGRAGAVRGRESDSWGLTFWRPHDTSHPQTERLQLGERKATFPFGAAHRVAASAPPRTTPACGPAGPCSELVHCRDEVSGGRLCETRSCTAWHQTLARRSRPRIFLGERGRLAQPSGTLCLGC